ncbi:MAG TPA: outer membrane beta-barrel protein [Rhodopseudomonas sp.]|uniref:outer membrane protein n=1 Tax=Rhodopseudomonas sp. TaxID=1078 RepID=UPI002ED89572
MRRVVLGAMVLAAAQAAHAADLPFLRGALSDGPTPTVNWQGFYVGGQGAYGSSDMNFTNSTQGLAAQMLALTTIESENQVSKWPILSKQSVHGHGYGGFAGYNWQWDDVVLGLEASYVHGTFGGSDSGSMGRSFTTSDGYTNGVLYQGDAAINIKDMGSVRARAGYAWGSFLPYMFGGVSLGQADIIRTASVSGTQVNPAAAAGFQTINFSDSLSTAQHGHFIYGYAGGLGVDMMLFSGLFLRAEWEYLKFAAPVDTSINTVRAGVGYKF